MAPARLVCATRANKNLRFLKETAPELARLLEESSGFPGGVPLASLASLHLPGRGPIPGVDAELAAQLAGVRFPQVRQVAARPLFNGTVHFVQIKFNVPAAPAETPVITSDADMTTAVNYAIRAAVPISIYANQYVNQFGPPRLTISPEFLRYEVTIRRENGTTYTKDDLEDWVSRISADNELSPNENCIAILNPPELTYSGCRRPLPGDCGCGGVHDRRGQADPPYLFVNVGYRVVSGRRNNWTVSDQDDSFALILSHELAEMVVDPDPYHHAPDPDEHGIITDKPSNPEVCDPCAIGGFACAFRCFFGESGEYLATSQAFLPSFEYSFFINAIVQPQFIGNMSCQAPFGACDSPPSPPAAVGELHVECTAMNNGLWEVVRSDNDNWSTFGSVNNWAKVDPLEVELKNLVGVATAALADELHVVCISSDGGLWEVVRNSDGTWTTFVDVSGRDDVTAGLNPGPLIGVSAAAIGFLQKAPGAGPGVQILLFDALHVVCISALSSGGKLWEVIRNLDGTWSTFGDVLNRAEVRTGPQPGPLIAVSAAVMADGLHVICISSDGRLWEVVRNSDGTWSTFEDVSGHADVNAGPNPEPLAAVSMAVFAEFQLVAGPGRPVRILTYDVLHVACISTNGDLWEVSRGPDGWSTFRKVWYPAKFLAGPRPDPGRLIGVSAAALGHQLHVICTSADGKLWEIIRYPDDTWTTFEDVSDRADVRSGLKPGLLIGVSAGTSFQDFQEIQD
jgi:hypothetical protein